MLEMEPSVVFSDIVGVSQSRFQTNNRHNTIPKTQISSEAQIWLVALKIVFNFFRFKPALI